MGHFFWKFSKQKIWTFSLENFFANPRILGLPTRKFFWKIQKNLRFFSKIFLNTGNLDLYLDSPSHKNFFRTLPLLKKIWGSLLEIFCKGQKICTFCPFSLEICYRKFRKFRPSVLGNFFPQKTQVELDSFFCALQIFNPVSNALGLSNYQQKKLHENIR